MIFMEYRRMGKPGLGTSRSNFRYLPTSSDPTLPIHRMANCSDLDKCPVFPARPGRPEYRLNDDADEVVNTLLSICFFACVASNVSINSSIEHASPVTRFKHVLAVRHFTSKPK